MSNIETAGDLFSNNFNCSQSVFCAFAPELGITPDTALRVACAFGAGIARQQLTCGAVTGALMVLGMKFGKGMNDHDSKKTFTYEKSGSMINAFISRHGSISCRDLLGGLDMVKDAEKIKELNLFRTKCLTYVRDAVEITGELLRNDQK